MEITRIAGPTHGDKLGIVSIEALKLHLRITHTDEDALLAEMIETAYDHLTGYAGWTNGFCLLPETYEVFAAPWGADRAFEIPIRPFIDVTAFRRLTPGTADTYELIAATDYQISTLAGMGILRLNRGYLVPSTIGYRGNVRGYRIQVRAGYEDRSQIPAPMRMAIKLLAGEFYRNREASSETFLRKLPYGLEALAGRYRISPDHS